MKTLTEHTQAVWAETDLSAKKELANLMIDDFEFKDKQEAFREKLQEAQTGLAVDEIVTNITLVGSGLGVLK